MNIATVHTGPAQPKTTTSSYEVQEQTDGQLLITTHPARIPTFKVDAAVIAVGFGFTVLALDYFLIGAGLYAATLLLTMIGAGGMWGCLKILHRERRKDIRPCRFYVSSSAINIPPALGGDGKSTMLMASQIDRLTIRESVYRTETTAYGFGQVGAKGAEAKDARAAWFADHSFILEAQSQGRAYLLANGLDEVTANGLMKAVSRKLDF